MKKTLTIIIIITVVIIIAIAGIMAVNFLIIKKSPEPTKPAVVSEEEVTKTEEKQEEQIVTKLTEEEEAFEKAEDLPMPSHPDAQLVNSEIKTILTEVFNGAKRTGGWIELDPQVNFRLYYKIKRKITIDDYNLLKIAFTNNGYTIESSEISGKNIEIEARKNLEGEKILPLELDCKIDEQEVEMGGEITSVSE